MGHESIKGPLNEPSKFPLHCVKSKALIRVVEGRVWIRRRLQTDGGSRIDEGQEAARRIAERVVREDPVGARGVAVVARPRLSRSASKSRSKDRGRRPLSEDKTRCGASTRDTLKTTLQGGLWGMGREEGREEGGTRNRDSPLPPLARAPTSCTANSAWTKSLAGLLLPACTSLDPPGASIRPPGGPSDGLTLGGTPITPRPPVVHRRGTLSSRRDARRQAYEVCVSALSQRRPRYQPTQRAAAPKRPALLNEAEESAETPAAIRGWQPLRETGGKGGRGSARWRCRHTTMPEMATRLGDAGAGGRPSSRGTLLRRLATDLVLGPPWALMGFWIWPR
ncbi:hypothetical protein KM043_005695 [Ampulex compressa]|nr:hypothetical protein KM043_005695 [Ampulex compressa]